MVRLQPMEEADFERYLARAIPRRAERFAARGIWTAEASLEASRQAYARQLPEGLGTPGQRFCHIVDETKQLRVGETWYSSTVEGGQVHFWVQWIWVEPEHRRRGYATAALQRLEEEASRLGAPRIVLEVWADNPDAMALYRKLGFVPAHLTLVKRVGPSGAGPLEG